MIRISTIISFTLIAGILLSWAALFKHGVDGFSLWRRGVTAVVLPIDNYDTRSVTRKDNVVDNFYVADLKVRLASGDVVDVPRKPVTLAHIQNSKTREIGIVFLPNNPQTNYFVGEEPPLLRFLLMACGISAVAFVWFRMRRQR